MPSPVTTLAVNPIKTPAYDVVISGAGPVGLFLACELALAKCSVLILEKDPSPESPLKHLPFGIRGLSAPTIEALDRRGLLPELKLHHRLKSPHTNVGPQRPAGHFAGIPFSAEDLDHLQWSYRLPSSTEPSLISEMAELKAILTRRSESLGVAIHRGLPITDYHPTANGVTVQCGDQSFAGRWLVGCDGSRSIVRKKGGFEFEGTEPEFTGYSLQLELANPEKLRPGRVVTATGMYLLSQPNYLVLQDFDGGAFHDSKRSVTLEHAQEVSRRISETDVTIRMLHLGTTWTDRARQAKRYRSGRVLLAGDAAHIHSPLGGQGLNLGMGDAMNLGWKLAATIQGYAPDGLIDSYHAERRPLGAQVLDWSRAQVAIMKPHPAARALHAIVRDLMETRDGATYFAGRVWGLTARYDLGGGHPLVGRSVPNFEFEDGVTIGALMRDGRGLLLDFEGNASLQSWASKYAGQIQCVSRRTKEPLGLKAALIRPDGIVAWASDDDPDCRQLQQAAAPWFTTASA